MFEKIEPLANTYDDIIIWDFLKTKDITKDNIVNFMSETLTTNSGCSNENCELNYNGAYQEFMEINDVGYDRINNKFIDLQGLLGENYEIDEKILNELDEKGIDPLDYFQFYFCPACGKLSYYIE